MQSCCSLWTLLSLHLQLVIPSTPYFLSLSGTMCTVIKSYKATKDDEITVNIGTVVEVLQKSDNGWWLVRYLFRSLTLLRT